MFWKRNNPSIFVDHPGHSRRQDYRVSPGAHTRMQLCIGGEPVELHDISANGVSFAANGTLPLATDAPALPALLYLGGERHPLPISLELIDRSGSLYRCRLRHHSLQSQKLLSRFIVLHQKREIRARHREAARGTGETATE